MINNLVIHQINVLGEKNADVTANSIDASKVNSKRFLLYMI
jgi:hypothetical protein